MRVAIVSDDDMTHLDPGERAAIALAQSERGALLLIDETAGRIEASRRGIRNTGTLGVLRAAALKPQKAHLECARDLNESLSTRREDGRSYAEE